MNYADLVFQKLNSLEQRINDLECKLFKLIASLEFIKSMDLNNPPKPPSQNLTYEQTVSQLLNC